MGRDDLGNQAVFHRHHGAVHACAEAVHQGHLGVRAAQQAFQHAGLEHEIAFDQHDVAILRQRF